MRRAQATIELLVLLALAIALTVVVAVAARAEGPSAGSSREETCVLAPTREARPKVTSTVAASGTRPAERGVTTPRASAAAPTGTS